MSAPAVECTGLMHRFGDTVAVDHLDLSIPAGVVFGLLGPNGAGMTTTIRVLNTLLPDRRLPRRAPRGDRPGRHARGRLPPLRRRRPGR